MSAPDAGRGHVGDHLAAAALFCVATLAAFGGALPDLGTSIGTQWGDPVFNLYILEWGSHQISRGLEGFWDAPFFYPTPHALAISDHLLGPAAAFHGLRALGVPVAAAYNLLVLITFALGGWATYFVLRRSGVSGTGAAVGGWAFAFSTFRWGSLGHYQTIRMQWIPLTLWSFDRVLARPTAGRAAAFLVFYVLHISGGAYLAYLVHLAMLVILVNRWQAEPERFRAAGSYAVWVPTAALALAAAAFFYSGYLASESPLVAGQRPDELRRGGATLSAFTPATALWLVSGAARGGGLFPGYGVLLLALAGLAWGWRRYAAPRESGARPFTGAALVVAGGATALAGLSLADRFTRSGEALLPALRGHGNAGYLLPLVVVVAGAAVLAGGLRTLQGGRVVQWGKMPVWPRGLLVSGAVMLPLCLPAFFWAVSTVLPGMSAMRVPQRAFAFVALPLAYLAGVGWDRLWAKAALSWWRRLVPVVTLALLVVESVSARPSFRREPLLEQVDFPQYAHWIAAHPEVEAYLELPRGRWPAAETVPMSLQTLHWRPMANGYSARHPPSYRQLIRMCQPFPNLDGLRTLQTWGITHLVVHWRALPWHPGPRVRRRVPLARPGFELDLRRFGARQVFVDGDTAIFDLRPAAEGP